MEKFGVRANMAATNRFKAAFVKLKEVLLDKNQHNEKRS
jgi:hypothetical protein